MKGLDDVRRYLRLGRKRVDVKRRRLAIEVLPSPTPLETDRAIDRLPDSPTVLCLCLGNICRSPMAERYLRARTPPDWTVDSAGFIDTEDRPSPDHAVEAAAEFGVDLTDHRSTRVTAEQLDRSDLVLLMDAYNDVLLRREFGHAAEKARYLKAFDDGDGYEITDPYGADPDEFQRVYREVADALDAFLQRIEERPVVVGGR